MDLAAIDAFLRVHFDALQYVAFFGALVLLGGLEAALASSGRSAERRRRWPANTALTVINIVVLGALPLGALAAADWAATNRLGVLAHPLVPPLVAIGLGVLLRSLVGYAIHVAMHRVPLLWRVHRVHHTDMAMDVSTTVRFHPLEFVISLPIVLAAVVALGIPPLAVIAYELFDAVMAVFTHANLRLRPRLERVLGLVLVTPDMHRRHHSASQPETDSNYGAMFSWWDRLFGTLGRGRAPQRLGLDEWRDRRIDSTWFLLALPFARGVAAPRPAAAEPQKVAP